MSRSLHFFLFINERSDLQEAHCENISLEKFRLKPYGAKKFRGIPLLKLFSFKFILVGCCSNAVWRLPNSSVDWIGLVIPLFPAHQFQTQISLRRSTGFTFWLQVDCTATAYIRSSVRDTVARKTSIPSTSRSWLTWTQTSPRHDLVIRRSRTPS